MFPCLDLDPNFADFNFCTIVDPALIPGHGPQCSVLYEMACRARMGDRHSAHELAETFYWTLKEGSFEAFKWMYGPRPISYEDWFYAKLFQFAEILLYEKLIVDHEHRAYTETPWEEGSLSGEGPIPPELELRSALRPDDLEHFDWWDFVHRVSNAGPKRLKLFETILQRQIKLKSANLTERPEASGGSTRTGWPGRQRLSKSDERNLVITSMRRRNATPAEICSMLDRRGFETTPGIQEYEVHSWTVALNDPDLRKNVQQIFAKAAKRFPDVK